MAHELEHGNDAFLWENLSWANLSNDISDNSGGDKTVLIPEEKEKEKENENEKKRSRSATKKRKGINGEKKERGETSDHEIRIWTERERRKKMGNMLSNLHSLLPQLPPKADKSTIVDEAVKYIKTLQSTLQRLQKQKLERLQGGSLVNTFEPSVIATSTLDRLSTRETFIADQVSSMNNSTNARTNTFSASASHLPVIIQTWTSSNVVLNICGNDANFAVYTPKKPGIFSNICFILDKYKLEATSVHISSDVDRCVYMIQATLTNDATNQFSEMTTVEEIYKQAAGEIMMCVAS